VHVQVHCKQRQQALRPAPDLALTLLWTLDAKAQRSDEQAVREVQRNAADACDSAEAGFYISE
jgi:hypothetical protein